jgi:hypothetical protein
MHFILKKVLFSFLPTNLNKYLIKQDRHFNRNGLYSTEISKKLKSFTAFYAHKQNATTINNIKQNISCNFIHFDDEQIQFNFFQRYPTPVQNSDFSLFKFKFKLLIAKIQYHSYLAITAKS